MFTFRVDDLDAVLEARSAEGVKVDSRREDSESGRFGTAMDAEGNCLEWWEPQTAKPKPATVKPKKPAVAMGAKAKKKTEWRQPAQRRRVQPTSSQEPSASSRNAHQRSRRSRASSSR